MKYVIALILLTCLGLSFAFGQYEDRYWVLGRTNSPANTTNVSFDFYPSGLSLYNTAEAPPAINPPPVSISSTNGFEGWGVVTDPSTGELLFYTDGNSVYDGNHQDITPAGGLGASPSSAQAVAISVVPVCPFNQYYIFSNPTGVFGGGHTDDPVTYRTYTLGSGFSAVLPLPGPNGNLDVGEGMVIIPSKTDPFLYWLVIRLLAPTANGSDYVVYRIDASGISFHATYNLGPPITDNPYSPIMNMAFIDNGSTEDVIVGFSASGSPNQVFTNVFNTSTGFFAGTATIIASISTGTLYDLEFSPGGNFIYYATYSPSALYQVPINGGTPVQMRNFGNQRGGGLKRAPDGYIYHTYHAGDISNSGAVRIGRIVEPETSSNGSNFNTLYQADFNSAVSMVYNNVFAYNFPEFANVPSWTVDIFAQNDNPICLGNSTLILADINSLGQNIEGYSWSLNGDFLTTTTSASIEVDEGGIYQLEVVLEGGCSFVSNPVVIEIISTNLPQIDNILATGSDCGVGEGAITVEASGGTGQLSYALDDNDFQFENTFSNLPPGLYQITIQDANGCTAIQNTEIISTQGGPDITMVDITEASCLGNDGSISITASGGTGLLRYSVNDGADFQSDPTFSGLTAGSYTLIVFDAIGCMDSEMVDVPQLEDGPIIEALTSTVASCMDSDGTISVVANGVNVPLLYSIDGTNFQFDNQFSNLAADSYTLVVQDEKGCTASQSIQVQMPDNLPTIQNIMATLPNCNVEDGQLTVQASGGNGSLQFSINGNILQNENSFTGLASGGYTLFVQDELGCSVDSTFTLTEGHCPVYVPNVFSPNDDGINDRFQVYYDGNPGTLINKYLIFDRWGELIFESNDFHPAETDQFWNGDFRGNKMGNGVYVYLIEVAYADGFVEIFTGDVTLLK